MLAILILLSLLFSKFFYLSSLTSYYIFYLISKFHLPVQSAQIYLFVFLGAAALGTFAGGPIGDRIGRKYVIWFSILGVSRSRWRCPTRIFSGPAFSPCALA